MDLAVRGLDSEQAAAHLGVARHPLPIDIVAQRFGDRDALGGQFLHVVGEAGELTMIAILQRGFGLVHVAAELLQQARAKCAMLCDELAIRATMSMPAYSEMLTPSKPS